jgi:hypothetical protein
MSLKQYNNQVFRGGVFLLPSFGGVGGGFR